MLLECSKEDSADWANNNVVETHTSAQQSPYLSYHTEPQVFHDEGATIHEETFRCPDCCHILRCVRGKQVISLSQWTICLRLIQLDTSRKTQFRIKNLSARSQERFPHFYTQNASSARIHAIEKRSIYPGELCDLKTGMLSEKRSTCRNLCHDSPKNPEFRSLL